jgi:hypothetical protein
MIDDPKDLLPDVRDGLTRLERVILYTLHEAKADFGDRNVPTLTLYGRVCERVPCSKHTFMVALTRMIGRGARA